MISIICVLLVIFLDEPTDDEALAALWEAGLLDWMLHDSQKLIHRQITALPIGVKEAIILCCRRFGKSFYGCIRGLELGIRADRRKVIRIIGPDIKQTLMIVEHNMAKICEPLNRLGLSSLVQQVKSENMYLVGKHSGIFIGGFDSQKDSLRGGEANEILIEETGSANPDQYNYQMKSILKPQLLKTRGRMIHLTTLPRATDHPFIVEAIPEAKLNDAFYSFTLYEDPLATPEIIADAIKDSGGVNSGTFRREYLNEIVREDSMMIVPDFNKDIHVIHIVIPSRAKYQTVIDFGGVRDKTVALLQFYDFKRAKLCIKAERTFDANTPTASIVDGVYDMERLIPEGSSHRRWADCPGQTQVDLSDAHAFAVSVPLKDDWQAGVNAMQLRFTWNEIEVDPSCKLLIASLESGQYNKQRTDFGRTKALGHCDALAALMYGNRMADQVNPYDRLYESPDKTFVRPAADSDIVQVAKAMQPRTFRTEFTSDGFRSKRFGGFRK